MEQNAQQYETYAKALPSGRRASIWSVGGGKGGVGKSLISANLSVCLALLGHKVVAIDLDLGGANLHTCLGVPIPENTLSDFFQDPTMKVDSLLTNTLLPGLKLISGAQDHVEVTNIQRVHRRRLLAQLSRLDVDYIILDLGAGTSTSTLDFFLASDKGIITALPEPTSIENTYRFLKAAFHRRLKLTPRAQEVDNIIDQVLNSKLTDAVAPTKLLEKIHTLSPGLGQSLYNDLAGWNLNLILNQSRGERDILLGQSMKTICKQYFGVQMNFAGHLNYDSSVWQSVKKKRPLLIEFPQSGLVRNFESILSELVGGPT